MSVLDWIVTARLVRERPLDGAEAAAIDAHVATWATRAWTGAPYALVRGASPELASGRFALVLDFDKQDAEWLGEALDELARLVDGAKLEVTDSLFDREIQPFTIVVYHTDAALIQATGNLSFDDAPVLPNERMPPDDFGHDPAEVLASEDIAL